MTRRLLAEFIGTALLLAVVVGSGIAAQRLSPTDVGLELFENAIATAAGLVAIISAVGPVSGAHLNPLVTLADRLLGAPIRWAEVAGYAVAQFAGAACGTVVANLMFGASAIDVSSKLRGGSGLLLGEAVATFGLLLVIFGVVRSRQGAASALAVGSYIGAAYLFTSSTSFANPAVTIGRTLSNTFAGIAPASAPAFIALQIAGAAVAVVAIRYMYPSMAADAGDVVIPHQSGKGLAMTEPR